MSLYLKVLGVKDVKDLCIDLSGNSTVSATHVFDKIKERLNVPLKNIQLINKGRNVTDMQLLTKDDKLLVKITRDLKKSVEEERMPCETSGCNFYGTISTDNLCSVCFKKKTKKPKIEDSSGGGDSDSDNISHSLKDGEVVTDQVDINEIMKNMTPSSKCKMCNKRVGLLGFACGCGGVYCATHRHLEQHKCTFDYKSKNSAALEKSLTRIVKNKLDRI